MSERRRLLLAIANQFKWLPYSYENLYYGLVPTTISGKSVRNKARIEKVYGNSVVENQLVENAMYNASTKPNGWQQNRTQITSISGSAGTIKLNDNNSGSSIYQLNTLVSGHNYVVKMSVFCSKATTVRVLLGTSTLIPATSIVANKWTELIGIATYSSGTNQFSFYPNYSSKLVANDTVEYKEIRLTDLNKYNPFNTPTTLTDTRVQALLNRGYIPYNTGEIKSVDIGEISSESYNLCDKSFTAYSYGSDYLKYNSNNSIYLLAGDYTIEINGGVDSYIQAFSSPKTSDILPILSAFSSLPTNTTLTWNDKCISTNTGSASISFTLTSNCYLTICGKSSTRENVCIHKSGTRTGYAPHQTFSPISFKYQGAGVGTSHDTLEITSSGYVFTKNMNRYTFSGSEVWNPVSTNWFYTGAIGSLVKRPQVSEVANAICESLKCYSQSSLGGVSLGFAIHNNGAFSVKNVDIASASDMQTYMIGKTVEYQLATPQVIRIPRKRLGVVDLGSLDYSSTTNDRFTTSNVGAKYVGDTSELSNVYCSLYMTTSLVGSSTNNMVITVRSNGELMIRDLSLVGLTNAQIQAKLSGIYAFFETTNEVEDMPFLLGIESGGTITTDSEVLPNVDFEMKCK